MKLFRTVLALAVVGGLTLCAMNSDVLAQKKGQNGKVVEYKDGKDGKDGSITISFKAKKDDTEVTKKTYKITKDTKVMKAGEKKGDEPIAAAAKDIMSGDKASFVNVQTSETAPDTATVITIMAGKKKAAN